MGPRFTLFAVVLPVLVLCAGIVRSEHHLRTSGSFQFQVEGYDPRDLLRGRYLRYRLKLKEEAALDQCDAKVPGDCCYCLTRTGADSVPTVQPASCGLALQQCDGVLDRRYLSELRRYYIPEAQAERIEERFLRAAGRGEAILHLAIDDEGKPRVERMTLSGRSIH